MKKQAYAITRDKFLDREERAKLLGTCKDKAELDLLHGRRTWIVRYMLVDLVLYSGLRVQEIADLKIGDLYLKPYPKERITESEKTFSNRITKKL